MGVFDFLFGRNITYGDSQAISNAINRSVNTNFGRPSNCENWDWHPDYKPKLHGEFKMYARIESEIGKACGYKVFHPLDTPYWLEQDVKLKGIDIVYDLFESGTINQRMKDIAIERLIDSYQAYEHGVYRV